MIISRRLLHEPVLSAASSTVGLRLHRLNVPDHLRVLINATVAREKAHARDARDGLCQPLILLLVRLVDQLLRVDVRLEVVRDEVVIAVVDDRVDQVRELAGVAKHALADGLEHFLEHRVEVELLVEVRVAEVFDILAQVAEEEDILFSNLTSDLGLRVSYSFSCRRDNAAYLNIRTIAGTDDETAVQYELHVAVRESARLQRINHGGRQELTMYQKLRYRQSRCAPRCRRQGR
jgi:hypothetical protein